MVYTLAREKISILWADKCVRVCVKCQYWEQQVMVRERDKGESP